MPIHEYECDNCGHRFERIQKFSDPPISECPKCGGPVHKLISSPAFQFKGTGWYITDYAKKDSSGKGASESKDSGKDSSKEGSKDSSSSSSDSKSSESKSDGSKTESSKSSSSSSSDSSKPKA